MWVFWFNLGPMPHKDQEALLEVWASLRADDAFRAALEARDRYSPEEIGALTNTLAGRLRRSSGERGDKSFGE